LGEKGAWAYPGTSPIFTVPPIISGMRKATKRYEVQIWQIYSQRTFEQKSFKDLGEKGALAYPGRSQIFTVPCIISGTRKALQI